MVVPILCKDCKNQFCFKHRFGGDHSCIGPVKKLATGAGKGKGMLGTGLRKVTSIGKVGSTSKLPPPKPKPSPPKASKPSKSLISQSSSTSAAASAAEARASYRGKGSKNDPIIISDDEEEEEVRILSGPRKALIALKPATKGDRRAMAEQASARRALAMRASKG